MYLSGRYLAGKFSSRRDMIPFDGMHGEPWVQ